jgi:hypothetical protein
MSDFQAIADRVEIEAPGEFTDAATMRGGTASRRCSRTTAFLRMPQHPAPGCPQPSVRSSPGRALTPKPPSPRRGPGNADPAPPAPCDPATPATSPGGTMTSAMPATPFAGPAPAQRLERAATALRSHGFTVEILDDAAAARTRIKDLIPQDASVSPRPARPCACRAFTRTSTPAGATRPSGHAPWPWTASPAPTTSGG